MNRSVCRRSLGPLLLSLLILTALAASVHPVSAYAPHSGDAFRYSETTTVSNGQGSYTGYSDQTLTTGEEEIQSITGNDVLTHYSYNYSFSSNQGNSSSGSKSGDYSWSTGTFTYVNGTDNQVGYSEPIYVWFAMDPSLPVGGTIWALNTHLVILASNYSLQLPTEGKYVQTIEAKGTGQYQRNDAYGVFTATYTWYEYFDPATGYIIGYNYTEQDTGSYQGQAGGFTFTDVLYVTSTSYPLSATPAPTTTTATGALTFTPYLEVLIPVVVVVIIVGVLALAVRGRRQRGPLPEHPPSVPPPGPSAPPPPPPPPEPWGSNVNLGSKPSEQVVIREVAKVACKYCFPPGQEIITSEGLKPIESVSAGDFVLTHTGFFQRVTRVLTRKYAGELIEVKTWGSYFVTRATPEHPFLASHLIWNNDRSKLVQLHWVEAEALKVGDFLCLPRPKETPAPASISVTSSMRTRWGTLSIKEESIPLTDDFLSVAGWYLAEGWFSRSSRDIVFSLGKSQLEYHRAFELKASIERLGISTRLEVSKNGVRVHAYSTKLGRVLAKHFGEGAARKRLPQWVLRLPIQKAAILLESYLEGDGYKISEGKFVSSTVSRQLAHGLELLGMKCGYLSGVRIKRRGGKGKILGRDVNLNTSYFVDLVQYTGQRKRRGSLDENVVYHRVKRIGRERFEGVVYNLEVEGDNSFCTPAHTVHNCGTLIPTTVDRCPYCGGPRE